MTVDEKQKLRDTLQEQINQLQMGLMDLYAQLRSNNTPSEENVLRAQILGKQQVAEKFQQQLKTL